MTGVHRWSRLTALRKLQLRIAESEAAVQRAWTRQAERVVESVRLACVDADSLQTDGCASMLAAERSLREHTLRTALHSRAQATQRRQVSYAFETTARVEHEQAVIHLERVSDARMDAAALAEGKAMDDGTLVRRHWRENAANKE